MLVFDRCQPCAYFLVPQVRLISSLEGANDLRFFR